MMNSMPKRVKIEITLKIEAFFFLIKRISLPVLLFTAMLFQISAAAEPRDSFIHFKDEALEAAVREKLKTTGEITAEDRAQLTELKIKTGVVRVIKHPDTGPIMRLKAGQNSQNIIRVKSKLNMRRFG